MKVRFYNWNSQNDNRAFIVLNSIIITRKELKIITSVMLSLSESTEKTITICSSDNICIIENKKYSLVFEEITDDESSFLHIYKLICKLSDGLPSSLRLLVPFDKIKKITRVKDKKLLYKRKIIEQTTE